MSNDKTHQSSTGADPFKAACEHSHNHIVEYYVSINLDKACTTAGMEYTATLIILSGLPIDILRRLVSRGLSNTLAIAASDLELLSEPLAHNSANLLSIVTLLWAVNHPETFELIFRTCFPFWRNLPPRRKQEILMLLPFEFGSINGILLQTVDAFRLLACPDGPVRKIDVQAWIDDGASLLHQVFSWYLNSPSRGRDRDWRTLLEEVIQATEDVHRRLELPCSRVSGYAGNIDFNAFYIGPQSALGWALVAVLNGLLRPNRYILEENSNVRRLLKKTMVNLQATMSILASCGYDLLEFGHQEAAIWLSVDNTDRTVGDTLYLGIGDYQDGLPFVRAIHYGAEPIDWYFDMDFHYEDYAGDFWYLLESPRPDVFVLPGAWID